MSPKKRLKNKLEKIIKAIVKDRDNYECQKCGTEVKGSNCHASHVIPVSRDGRLAFDPINLKVLCFHCHINWWHKYPTESGPWFKNKFPDRYEYLEEQHQKNIGLGSISEQWYRDQIEYYG